MNFSKFPKLNTKMMAKLDSMLAEEIPYTSWTPSPPSSDRVSKALEN
jgi:hypothetical protein